MGKLARLPPAASVQLPAQSMPDSAPGPVLYRPRPLKLPSHLGLSREVARFRENIKPHRPSFDLDTLFYDVFRSHDRRKIIALGPELRNLAADVLPLRIECGGRRLRYRCNKLRNRKLALHYPEELHILEIFADESLLASDEPLELVFRWKSFEQRAEVPPNPLAALPPVGLTLYTLQKDNPPEWLRDWCLYHHRVHGVGRVVIYDNGSADAAALPGHLAALDAGLDTVLIDWPFPYGDHLNQPCQHGSLNHCPRIFGDRSAYYLSFDVDEYLVNRTSLPLRDYLDKRLTGAVAALLVPEVWAPYIRLDTGRLARVTDYDVRYKSLADVHPDAVMRPKPVFRHKGTRYVGVHLCRPQMPKAGLVVEKLRRIWEWLHWRCGVWMPSHCFRKMQIRLPGFYLWEECAGRDLYYLHYQGLFSDWKEGEPPARVPVAFDPAIHEADTEMPPILKKHRSGQ